MPTKAPRRRSPKLASVEKPQTESPILRQILVWLYDNDYFIWRQNSGACKSGRRWIRFGFKGCADIIGMMPDGRFLAIEVKSPTGSLRPEQVRFLERVRQNNGVAIVAHELDTVVKILAKEASARGAR